MKTKLAANELSRYDVDSILYALRNLGEVFDHLDFGEQRQLLRSVLSSVVVDKHEVTYNVFALPGLIVDSAHMGIGSEDRSNDPPTLDRVHVLAEGGRWPSRTRPVRS